MSTTGQALEPRCGKCSDGLEHFSVGLVDHGSSTAPIRCTKCGGQALYVLQNVPPTGSAASLVGVTGIEAQVCADLEKRQRRGLSKYGVTVEDNPLTRHQWLQHAYEEALDLAVYLKRLLTLPP